MKSRLFATLCLVLFFSSCASKQGNFTDQVSPDLVKTFDLKDSKFDKFKVVEDKGKTEVPKQEKTKDPIKKAKANDTKKPKEKLKKKINKTTTEKSQKDKTKVVMVDKTEEEILPEDYPEDFLKYDKESKGIWEKFVPNAWPGEESVIQISYLGVTAGHIKVKVRNKVKVAGKTAYHFSAHLKSAKYYSMIYSLDDKIETYVDTRNFIPIKYSLVQRESNKSVDDLQLFDLDSKTTYFWYKRTKKGKLTKREKTSFIPGYFQDNFSALYFVRGLPLGPGNKYTFPLVTRGKILLMTMKFVKTETIEIMDRNTEVIKLEAEMILPGLMKKKGKVTFWYSNDEVRKLLKFEAKVKIGSIEGELVDYKAGQKGKF
ncbi:MAG: DUF3108 domain-containing protein [Bacteriovoracaceae bacterium]|nr:DUF3108 domain-containing protein [Bacteriovoracaceae bacterium]